MEIGFKTIVSSFGNFFRRCFYVQLRNREIFLRSDFFFIQKKSHKSFLNNLKFYFLNSFFILLFCKTNMDFSIFCSFYVQLRNYLLSSKSISFVQKYVTRASRTTVNFIHKKFIYYHKNYLMVEKYDYLLSS